MLCNAIRPGTREDCFTSHGMVGNARKRDNPEKLCKKNFPPRICTNFRQEELFTRILLTNFQLEEEYFKFKGFGSSCISVSTCSLCLSLSDLLVFVVGIVLVHPCLSMFLLLLPQKSQESC